MNYSKALECAVQLQNLNIDLGEIPINIYLKDTGDVLTLCFIEKEKEDCLIVVETNITGGEEIRIIPKDNIEYVSIFYDVELVVDVSFDSMFV